MTAADVPEIRLAAFCTLVSPSNRAIGPNGETSPVRYTQSGVFCVKGELKRSSC
jgi:hypothetical protein